MQGYRDEDEDMIEEGEVVQGHKKKVFDFDFYDSKYIIHIAIWIKMEFIIMIIESCI